MIRLRTWSAVLATAMALIGTPAGADEEQIARGQEVYAEARCRKCHAINGVGNKRWPLDGVGGKLPPEQIRKWIVAPKEMDPKVKKKGFDKLPVADVDALVAYLSSLK